MGILEIRNDTRSAFHATCDRVVISGRNRYPCIFKVKFATLASTWLGHRFRKVDVRLPGKGNSNSHGARPVHRIISIMKWIRTIKLSIQKSL
jgi:hypothetical protein